MISNADNKAIMDPPSNKSMQQPGRPEPVEVQPPTREWYFAPCGDVPEVTMAAATEEAAIEMYNDYYNNFINV